jgi:hypothetical protein
MGRQLVDAADGKMSPLDRVSQRTVSQAVLSVVEVLVVQITPLFPDSGDVRLLYASDSGTSGYFDIPLFPIESTSTYSSSKMVSDDLSTHLCFCGGLLRLPGRADQEK